MFLHILYYAYRSERLEPGFGAALLLSQFILLHPDFPSLYAFLLPVVFLSTLQDLQSMEIPDLCSLSLLIYGLLHTNSMHLQAALLFLLIGSLLSRMGLLGFGDVKYLSAWTLTAGVLVFLTMAVASFTALCTTAWKKESGRIPFAPYLSFGMLVTALFLC